MEFSSQGFWSGLPFPSPGDLPDPGMKLSSPALQADSLLSEPSGKPYIYIYLSMYLNHFAAHLKLQNYKSTVLQLKNKLKFKQRNKHVS